jgi:hypothetical protein
MGIFLDVGKSERNQVNRSKLKTNHKTNSKSFHHLRHTTGSKYFHHLREDVVSLFILYIILL